MNRPVLFVLAGCLWSWAPPASALVAVYEVSFDAIWSQATHPVDFPPNPHFSGLVGGTHDETLGFWEEGGVGAPDPRCIGAPNRLLEHGGGCGLLGIEPFLLLAPLLLVRRRIAQGQRRIQPPDGRSL